jgi:eukaryotic-like serine/threonine-protein kinase
MYSSYGGPNAMQPPPRLLQRLGGYAINAVLGQGAMAVVYRARSPQGQMVALKVLTEIAASQPKLRTMFQSEYRITSRLKHPGVVQVRDAGTIDGHFFIAMDLVEGKTLQEFQGKDKGLGEAPAMNLVRQLAGTLDYVHQQQVVHRDLKPTNIFITQDGRALLFDFGAALDLRVPVAEEASGIYGTPGFLAPEQIRNGNAVDGRADLYSLGIIFYRMITGRRPFYGSREEVLDAHLYTPPPPPSAVSYISPQLEIVLLKLLAKDPATRYQTGAELLHALDQIQLQAPPERTPQRLLRWLLARE